MIDESGGYYDEKRGQLLPFVLKKGKPAKKEENPFKLRGLEYMRKHFLVLILAFLFLLAIGVYFFKSNSSAKQDDDALICGDGTSYGECSLRKPYFCLNGTLVEKASMCGCPEILKKKGDSCLSKYQTGPINITLNYLLRGEEREINFTIYKGMVDYISDLSKTLPYENGEMPSRRDFKLRNINEPEQRELLLPLVTKIQNIAKDKEEQMRIAVSIVQHIEFGASDKIIRVGPHQKVNYSRYPYEVLYDGRGVCGEKSELLAFLLKEIGYEVVFFYNKPENHEALGIRCPIKYSQYVFNDTGYCFIETTGPSIINDNEIEYVGGIKLFSVPEVIPISEGDSLGENLYEYNDAEEWKKIRRILDERGKISFFKYLRWKKLRDKYGIGGEYNI